MGRDQIEAVRSRRVPCLPGQGTGFDPVCAFSALSFSSSWLPYRSTTPAASLSYNYQLVVQWIMRSAIQARLDDRSQKRLAILVRELGWTPSQVVREGLRILEASYLRRKKQGIIGLGKFRSGESDLGSNKKHLRNFGR
jgi:hypothetical protein